MLHRPPSISVIVLFALVAAGAVLRGWAIGLESMWYDELLSAWAIHDGFADVWPRVKDGHAPLYFWLLKAWSLAAGDSDAALRAFSIPWDLASIVLVFVLARRLFPQDARIAPTVAAFQTFSPYLVYYSQEARMYTLETCLGLASALVLWEMLRGRSRPTHLVAYVALTTLFLYLHLIALFYFASQVAVGAVLLAARSPRRARRDCWLSWSLVAAFYLPWALVGAVQVGWARGVEKAGDWWIPAPPLKALIGPYWAYVGQSLPLLAVFAVAVILAISLPLIGRRWPSWSGRTDGNGKVIVAVVYLSCLAALPVVFSFAVSHLVMPVHVARYTIYCLPFFYLLAARGLAVLGLAGTVLATSVCVYLLLLSAGQYGNTGRAKGPFRDVARLIVSRGGAGQATLACGPSRGVEKIRSDALELGLERYLERETGDWVEIEVTPPDRCPAMLAERSWIVAWRADAGPCDDLVARCIGTARGEEPVAMGDLFVWEAVGPPPPAAGSDRRGPRAVSAVRQP